MPFEVAFFDCRYNSRYNNFTQDLSDLEKRCQNLLFVAEKTEKNRRL